MNEEPRDLGGFIRDLRRNARISLRQLAEQAGVSNPYLSQIERGLRKPSAEVLAQLASALRVSTPLMYLRAGLLEREGHDVLAAIAADSDLTTAQKQSLTQIYETFRRENARNSTDLADDGRAPDSDRASGGELALDGAPAGAVEPGRAGRPRTGTGPVAPDRAERGRRTAAQSPEPGQAPSPPDAGGAHVPSGPERAGTDAPVTQPTRSQEESQ
ncbi:helix-turn-helix transcriptional regulator [Dactylosporangium vinaceum]|uniref:Helix-turn-helix domain-containing protein n=1 Tax=Dactylosporangium vinaceum TaxID=53362 RepID=A0ABV5M0Z8_9ACTN|nr:helix-turn-helix transcriptional regulator [Dactylosporangium vinaceum]UAB97253.1 helix-turn-helix transcriptional regulator [Dactylosporangium vinaceum]